MNPLVLLSLLCLSNLYGNPVTYTGFTIGDCKLGSVAFHNARVYLTFRGDTDNVTLIHPLINPTDPSQGTVDILINQTGKASVTVTSGNQVVAADFAPNQLFVGLDQGDTAFAPHVGGRGVGFGSLSATGFEPAYPLGIEDGTLDLGDIVNDAPSTTRPLPSPGLTELSLDLVHNTGFSGRAWSCVGFPGTCLAANVLRTNKGDFYMYQPYSRGQSLSGGSFVTNVSEREFRDDDPEVSVPLMQRRKAESKNPITYHGYLISDIALGRETFYNAEIYFSFDADASTVMPFSAGHGWKNSVGQARVLVMSGSRTVAADFAPGQIYVYWDIDHASVGFGSLSKSGTSESGYPFSITGNSDTNGLVEESLVGAVLDLTLTPADAANYSAETASLATDLTNATTLSGGVSSCLGFDPSTSTCSSLTPVPLRTNKGELYLFEPYRQDASADGTARTYSVNWGIFWAETGTLHDD